MLGLFSFPPCKGMFLSMTLLCILLAQPAVQTLTNDKSPDTGPSLPSSSSVHLSFSEPQAITQNEKPEKQTPPGSPKVPEHAASTNHSFSNPAVSSQDSSQTAVEDDTLSPAQAPIKVLIVDTCIERDVQADSANLTKGQVRGQGREVELQPGSPLVLTHKISVAPGPCAGSCEVQFSALRKRLDKLEKEVSILRKKCGEADGEHCPSQLTEVQGDECPNDCSDQGRCDRGKCVCFPGFIGHDCSSATCPSGCHDKGTCVEGKCVCHTGFAGPDCSITSCPGNCSSRGRCVEGRCECNAGFKGKDCGMKSCPGNCSNKGRCVQGKCVCQPGFTGVTCNRCEAGLSGARCDKERIINKVKIETVTLKVTAGNDRVKGRMSATKVDQTVLSKTEEKKQSETWKGRGPGQKEDANKTRSESVVKSGMEQTHMKAEQDLKTSATKAHRKVESDVKSNTSKLEKKPGSELKSRSTNVLSKVDLNLKSNTTKADTDLKSSTAKLHSKVDSNLKSNTSKMDTKADSDLKSKTAKTQTKVDTRTDSDLETSTTTVDAKSDSSMKTYTAKTERKVDLDLKSGVAKIQSKSDSDQKSDTTKTDTNTDSHLKTGTAKAEAKPDSNLKSHTAKTETKVNLDQKSAAGKIQPEVDSKQKPSIAKKETKTDSDLKTGTVKAETKSDSNLNADTVKTQTKADSNLKSDTTTTEAKVDLDQRSGTAKIQTKANLDQKSGMSKIQMKSDSDAKSGAAKIQTKLDSDLKSSTVKADKKTDSDLKTDTVRTDTKADPELKSGTVKSHSKTDLKLSTSESHAKQIDGTESKLGNNATIVKKPTSTIHTNMTKTGQGEKIVDQASKKQAGDKKQDLTKTVTSDSKHDPKLDTKVERKPSVKVAEDGEVNSINRTHIKPHKSVRQNVNQSSDVVNQAKVTYKEKTVSAEGTKISEPQKDSVEQVTSTIKNATKSIDKKFIQKVKVGHGKVIKIQTDDKPSQPQSNTTVLQQVEKSSLQKSGLIHSTGSTSSTLTAKNETSKSIVKTRLVKHGVSSRNQTVVEKSRSSQGNNTDVSKGAVADTQNIKSEVSGTDTWKKTTSADAITDPNVPKNIQPNTIQSGQLSNWTKTNLRVPQQGPHPPKTNVQHTQPLTEETRNDGLGPLEVDGNSTARGSQKNIEMQGTISTSQLETSRVSARTEAKRDDSSSAKLKDSTATTTRNDTTSSSVNSSSTETNRTSSSTGKAELGLASVRVQNITSRGFSLIWEVLQGVFKQFIVTQREYGLEKDDENEVEEDEEDEDEKSKMTRSKTEGSLSRREGSKETIVQGAVSKGNVVSHRRNSNSSTTASGKSYNGTGFRTDGSNVKKVTQVVSGTTRSVTFRRLRPQTRYSLSLYGSSPGLRSKIHRLTVTTAPEPPTELLFSDVTDSSLSVSWTKPKSPVTGFKVTYANTDNGQPVSVTVDSQHSSVALSQLSPGSSYDVSVFSLKGLDESDPITGLVVTVPDPPTGLQVTNMTSSRAVLRWTPAVATVDRYIVLYGSDRVPSVTVIVSGKAAELQLKSLQAATVYRVTVTSQVDSLQSTAVKAVFTTAAESGPRLDGQPGLTASQVTAQSVVLSWKTPASKVTGYKLSYQKESEEIQEISLNSSVTQYKLTGLHPMSKYTVQLEVAMGGHYSPLVSSEFRTGSLRFPLPRDCSQALLNGLQHSGQTQIYPRGKQEQPMWVYCDMVTDRGGWTVFQRRMNGKTDFFRTWQEYRRGFGNLSEEFWLGNELIHILSSSVPTELRVDLRAGEESAFARYSTFSIESQRRHYAVRLSGYSGTAGDSMKYHNGQPFSTRDREPKAILSGCPLAYRGGWWYKDCHEANLNGLYETNTNHQGVIWTSWKGRDFSVPFTEMKIRPLSFTPQAQG